MIISRVVPTFASLFVLLSGCNQPGVDTGVAGAPAQREEARAPSTKAAPAPQAAKNGRAKNGSAKDVAAKNLEAPKSVEAALGGDADELQPHGDGDPGHCNCQNGECNTEVDEDGTVHEIHVGSAPIRGAARAPVTIVVFTDFECPFCAKAEATMHELAAKYGDKVRLAFKHNPLPFHAGARLASRAAIAAGEQGKFWEYHDKVFAHQDALGRDALVGYAKELGLDLVKFGAAMDAPRSNAAVDADIAEAKRLSVMGTPAFFVNGHRIVGAQPIEKFEGVIDAALARR